jgi:hypothetical protein
MVIRVKHFFASANPRGYRTPLTAALPGCHHHHPLLDAALGHTPEREYFLLFYPYPLLLVAAPGCSTQTLATAPLCGRRCFLSAMPSDLETEALRQRLDALVKDVDAAEAKAAAARCHVQVACLLLEEEQAAVANLHVQATVVPNIRQLVNIMLDTTSSNYAIWRDLMLMALTRYSLVDHILSNDAFIDDPMWTRMDTVVLCWLTNTVTSNLQEVVREHGHPAHHLWLVMENQFLGNHKTRTLHLDVVFCNFVQGDLSVTEYCRKFKGMANALVDLGSPVDDQILILNILRGLNQCFEHLGAIIRCSSPFPNFLKVRDDLLLEEIHLDTTRSSAAPMTLYISIAPPAPKPQPSAPSRLPNSNNNWNKNNNCHNCGNGGGNSGKNSSSSGSRGGNSGNTTAASTGSTSNDRRATSPWLTYINPW